LKLSGVTRTVSAEVTRFARVPIVFPLDQIPLYDRKKHKFRPEFRQ